MPRFQNGKVAPITHNLQRTYFNKLFRFTFPYLQQTQIRNIKLFQENV